MDLGGLRNFLIPKWLSPPAPEAFADARVVRRQGVEGTLDRLGALSLDLATLADVAISTTRRLAPCEHVELFLLSGGTFCNVDGSICGAVSDQPALERCVRTGQTRRSRPTTRGERGVFGAKVRLVLYVPVGTRDAVAGVLAFAWRSLKLSTAADVEAVEEFAARLGPALSTAVVHSRALEAERDARVLVEAVGALARTHTVEAVAEAACLFARRVAHVRRARLAVACEGDLVVAATNPGSRHPAHSTAPPSPGMHEAAATLEPVEEVTATTTGLSLPVTDGERLLGVLKFDFSPRPGGIPDRRRQLCEAVAAHTGVALERAHRTNELAWLATTDPLTGLANRRRLQADLCREIARSDRSGEPLAVAMLDLDHFKRYNDEHGHLEGDLLLATFGRFLNEQVRAMDTVGRCGGEEFLLILANTTAAEAAAAAVRLLRAWRGDGAGSTFSAGVAQRRPGETPDELLERADTAMYAAKRGGRERVEIAEADTDLIDLTGDVPARTGDDGSARVVPLHEISARRRTRDGTAGSGDGHV